MSENPVQKTASLHEKAVQAVARGDVQQQPQRRSARRTARPATVTTHHIKVDRRVLKVVQEILADKANTYSRMEIRSETEVVVR